MVDFREKFESTFRERTSILCVGLDPAIPKQRSNNTIPIEYFRKKTDEEARLNFCLHILDATAEFCVAAKPNEQYVRGFTAKQHRQLAGYIREKGLLSIYDCKLGDIRDSAEAAFFHFRQWGYDAITVNPFPGNLEELVKLAHQSAPSIGLIVLTLMSNPEAEKLMRDAKVNNNPVFIQIAKDVNRYSADGCVVGATGHVTFSDIALIRREAGDDKLLLIPGVGTQKGDPAKVVSAGGKNILINVGRDIIYAEDPSKKAREYNDLFNNLRKKA